MVSGDSIVLAGERNLTMWGFREYVEHAGVHHIRPDIGVELDEEGVKKHPF